MSSTAERNTSYDDSPYELYESPHNRGYTFPARTKRPPAPLPRRQVVPSVTGLNSRSLDESTSPRRRHTTESSERPSIQPRKCHVMPPRSKSDGQLLSHLRPIPFRRSPQVSRDFPWRHRTDKQDSQLGDPEVSPYEAIDIGAVRKRVDTESQCEQQVSFGLSTQETQADCVDEDSSAIYESYEEVRQHRCEREAEVAKDKLYVSLPESRCEDVKQDDQSQPLSSDDFLSDGEILTVVKYIKEHPDSISQQQLVRFLRNLDLKANTLLTAAVNQQVLVNLYGVVFSVLLAWKESAVGGISKRTLCSSLYRCGCAELAKYAASLTGMEEKMYYGYIVMSAEREELNASPEYGRVWQDQDSGVLS